MRRQYLYTAQKLFLEFDASVMAPHVSGNTTVF